MRKGITPVIAIVLLLMMTVAAAGVAYLFVNRLMGQAQTEVESEMGRTLSKMGDSITVIQGASEDSGATIALTIKNTGSGTLSAIGVTDSTVKVDRVLTGATIQATSTCDDSATSPGSTCIVRINGGTPAFSFPSVGNKKNIQIILKDGSSISYACVPTQVDYC